MPAKKTPRRSPAARPAKTAKPATSPTVRPPAPARPPRGEGPAHWLLKTEPEVFSIADLAAAPDGTTCWDGVRNYQARNTLRDLMKVGDRVLIHHSNADPPAVAGIAEVVREGYPDHTAFDPAHPHHDPDSDPAAPTWMMVDIRHVRTFARPVGLDRLKGVPALAGMELLRRGSRLSVQPVTPAEFAAVIALADADEGRG